MPSPLWASVSPDKELGGGVLKSPWVLVMDLQAVKPHSGDFCVLLEATRGLHLGFYRVSALSLKVSSRQHLCGKNCFL